MSAAADSSGDVTADGERAPRRDAASALRHPLNQIARKGRRRVLRLRKRAYHAVRVPASAERRTIIVLGCQRSGTTLMLDLFEEDPRTMTFHEFSGLSGVGEGGIRLRPLPEVKADIERVRAPITVLKPLVESQHAPHLLDRLPNARVVWMLRRFESVAASTITHFNPDTGENNLRLLLTNDPPNWRSELVPDSVRAVIDEYYAPDMNPYDAAALFWWARNQLFFYLDLDQRRDVFLCDYESLVDDPARVMRSIYGSCGVRPPARDTTTSVHSRARNRGESSVFSSDVRDLCEELHARLVGCSRAA
jgi:hypothetical protein